MFRIISFILFIVLAGAVGWMTFSWYRTLHGGEAYGAPFELVDHRGQPITEKAFQGHPSAVFFGFTHCPEVCPTTLFELSGWLDQLGEEGQEIRPFFVTVDPERDTPDIMENYVSNFSDRITAITGDVAKVAEMLKSFGIFARKVEQEGGGYTMDHTASIILLDDGGDLFGTIAFGESPDIAIAKLRRLANEG